MSRDRARKVRQAVEAIETVESAFCGVAVSVHAVWGVGRLRAVARKSGFGCDVIFCCSELYRKHAFKMGRHFEGIRRGLACMLRLSSAQRLRSSSSWMPTRVLTEGAVSS